MLELARGIGLAMDVGDLLELEAALEPERVVEVAPDEEDRVAVEGAGGEILDLLRVLQHALHLGRERQQFADELVIALRRESAEQVRQIDPEHVQQRQLRAVGLRRGHGDLRAGPGVEHVVALAGDRAAHHVDDREDARAEPFGLAQRGHGVQRLAGLADDDDEGLLVDQRIGIAELRGQGDIDLHAQQPLEVVFADHAHMVA